MRTEYEYPLPDGSPNRKVVRIDKSDGGKDIYQLSWNDQKFVPGNAHGEATWFNAPLLESMSQDGIDCLCIGEGEKVAQKGNGIVGVGMVFTTMAGGANAKMTENMKGLLQRWNPNRIRLYADRDQAGDEWANYMHTELTAMGMTVDGIWFPHPSVEAKGADLVDHLATGRSIHDMHRIDPPPLAPAAPTMQIDPNTGESNENRRDFVERVTGRVIWIPGKADPWHLRQEDGSVFEPGEHLVHRLGQGMAERRLHQFQQAGAARGIIGALKNRGTFAGVTATMMASRADLAVSIDEVGEHAYPEMLPVKNGILHLRTKTLQPHTGRYCFTKGIKTDYVEDAKCEQFLSNLEYWLPDPAVREWLQVFLGMGITGYQEQRILVCWGLGGEGKSTFKNIIAGIMGDFAKSMKADSWVKARMQGGGDKPRPDVMRTIGARTIFCSETSTDMPIDTVGLKNYVGGDQLTDRDLRQGVVAFNPQGAMIFLTNNPLRFPEIDRGIKRRVLYLPWTTVIPAEEQVQYIDRDILLNESEGVLRWLVDGAHTYLNDGLPPVPRVIQEKTNEFLNIEDDLAEFIELHLDMSDPEAVVPKRSVHSKFQEWAESAGFESWSLQKLARELARRGLSETRLNNTRCWRGVRIKQADAIYANNSKNIIS